jgi:hypothetical protein
MNTIILSSSEFNRDTGRTKKTANNGPVHITQTDIFAKPN